VSFLIVYLTESLGYSLVAAGLVLTVANVAGVVGRIAWGGFADLHLAPRELLGWLGVAAGSARSRPRLRADWPLAAILATSAVVRRDGDRLERRHALGSRAPRAAERVGAITGASGSSRSAA
jgi:hypothetical protein